MASTYRMDGWIKSVLGQAVAGALIYVCNQPANTASIPPSPLASIFSDPNGLVPLAQPIPADGFGHYDFYAAPGTYTVVVVNFGQVQQVYPDQSIFGFASTSILTPGANIAINGLVISAVNVVVTNPAANQSILGYSLLPATGNPTGQSLGNAGAPWDATLYDLAVQDSITFGHPGVLSEIVMSGATDPWGGRIQNAINALPLTGGLVDARAAGVAAIPQGFITFSGKPVTILLGPYTYTLNSIVVTTGTRIIGAGIGATILLAADTTTSVITMDQTTTVQGIELAYFHLTAGATSAYNQFGMSFVLNGTTNHGLWYSYLHDVNITHFGGVNLDFNALAGGTGNGSLNQFNNINHVIVARLSVPAWVSGTSYVPGNTVTVNNGTIVAYSGATAYAPGNLVLSGGIIYMATTNTTGNAPPNASFWLGISPFQSAQTFVNTAPTSSANPFNGSFWAPYDSYALRISGYSGQLFFDQCQLDSDFGGPNSGINIGIISGPSATFDLANGLTFTACTCQFAALGVYIAGGLSIHFRECHHESLRGGYLLDFISPNSGTWGFEVSGGYWATNVCVNGGAGYAVQFTSNIVTGGDLVFTGNGFFNECDNVVMGNGCLDVVIRDNATLSQNPTNGPYSGNTPTLTAAAALNASRNHCCYVTGTTPIQNILSLLGPGEILTLIASTSGVNLITGGAPGAQLFLGTHSTVTLEAGGGVTLVRSDNTNMNGWVLVGATP
jgi:hypothetical protein